MFDLGVTKDQEIERQKQEEQNEEEDQDKDLPFYQLAIACKKYFIQHRYNLRPVVEKWSIPRPYWRLHNYKVVETFL